MISIVSVSFGPSDWCDLLIDSINKTRSEEVEIIIIDNSNTVFRDDVRVIKQNNPGHGASLDIAIQEATGEYILVLDIDAHILRKGWENELRGALKDNVRLVAARDGDLKPFIPCVMFFEKSYFKGKDLSFQPIPIKNMAIDTGVYVGMKTLHDGHQIHPLLVQGTIYPDTWGYTYYLNGSATFYHHWYGTRFTNHTVVDGRHKADFLKSKELMFKLYETQFGSWK